MPDIPELSASKRALLEKYLRGNIQQQAKNANTPLQKEPGNPVPQPSPDTRSSVVALQSSGSKPPFFFLHVHVEGGAFYCFTLANVLGSDQPFYVLEPYRFDGMRVPPTPEAMAADYIQALRSVQPEGPYFLGGFCGGGLLAFEVAQQLRAQGQEVSLLVLIEPRAGPDFFRMVGSRLTGRFVQGLGFVLRFSQEKQLHVFLYLRHIYRLLQYKLLRPSQDPSLHLSLVPTGEMLRHDWIGIFVWVFSHYLPRYYPGKLIYLWARDEPGNRWVGKLGNVVKAEEVEIQFIPGTQWSCRHEHLHEMAQQLKVCLDKAQASALRA
ncbi:MAG TPA: thioesterase domain-containing protein [Ktedonobacteraceae bacterium]